MSTATGNTASSSTPINVYLYAGDQIIENVTMGYFYFQDSLGNTSHVSNEAGTVLERYTYTSFGTPSFFDGAGNSRTASHYGIRHLFHGQLWTQETGLIDHRYRQALPAMGIFIQPDPIRFAGDPSNLYRYCSNNPVNWRDPFGLQSPDSTKKNEGIYSGSPSSGTFVSGGQDSFIDRVIQEVFGSGTDGGGAGSVGSSSAGGAASGGIGGILGAGGDKGGLLGPAAGGNGLGLSNVDAHGIGDGRGSGGALRQIGVFLVAAGNAYERTVNFLAGVGPEVTFYGPGTIEVEQMKGSAFARETVQAFKDSGSPGSGIQRNGGDGIFNPFAPSVILNPTRQFVGTYNAAVDPIGEKQVVVILQNQTSMHSAGYKMLPSWSRSDFGPGGTVTQYYWWIEDAP